MGVIPAQRMKKVKGGAKPFVVPLTDAMVDVLNSLPRFTSGEFLFSHSYGKRPLKPEPVFRHQKTARRNHAGRARQIAIERDNDPEHVVLPDFVNHYVRRSVRTHLSALKIGEEVREAVLAHVRPGIKGMYDKHQIWTKSARP